MHQILLLFCGSGYKETYDKLIIQYIKKWSTGRPAGDFLTLRSAYDHHISWNPSNKVSILTSSYNMWHSTSTLKIPLFYFASDQREIQTRSPPKHFLQLEKGKR